MNTLQYPFVFLLAGVLLPSFNVHCPPEESKAASNDQLLKIIASAKKRQPRLEAIRVLRDRRELPRKVPAVLLTALTDPDKNIRAAVADLLDRFSDEQTVDALIKTVKTDSQVIVRVAAIRSLGQIGAPATKAIPCLITVMKEAREWDRTGMIHYLSVRDGWPNCYAASAVIAIGSDVIPGLVELANDRKVDVPIRRLALSTIFIMGKSTQLATSALIRLTTDPEESIRLDAIECLVVIDPNSRDVHRAILGCLADTSSYIRVVAAASFNDLDPANVITVPVLTQALTSSSRDTKWRAATELGLLGKKAKSAIKPIAQLLASPDESLREAAAGALGSIGPDARIVLPDLLQATHDKNRDVSDAAKDAIKQIQRDIKR